jgi:type IV secretory pathway VirB2 component (pilin)
MKFRKITTALSVVSLLALPIVAQAISFEDPSTSLGLGTADLKETVINIINWILGLLGIIAVIMILYAGFQWMTAGGNEDKVSSAKKIISAAIIGLIIILLAWAIVNFVLKTAGNVTGAT